MPEDELQIPVLYCHPSVLWSGKARDGFCCRLLYDLRIERGVYSPCKSASELDNPCPNVLLHEVVVSVVSRGRVVRRSAGMKRILG